MPNVPLAPAVLRLVQALVVGRWRAAGEDLYREVASELGVSAGQEIIVSGCADGMSCEWLAQRTGAAVTGIDWDGEDIEEADERSRATSLPLAFQQAPLDDLPHETAVFDAAVGEPVLAEARDPARAVAELVRVTKPMGVVVLLQLSWGTALSADARSLLVDRLGLKPHHVVEWKQMLRDAGVVDLQVQDWTDEGDEAPGVGDEPKLSWKDKMQIVSGSFRRLRWREALEAVERESTLLRELARERALGFQLIRGVKWPHARET